MGQYARQGQVCFPMLSVAEANCQAPNYFCEFMAWKWRVSSPFFPGKKELLKNGSTTCQMSCSWHLQPPAFCAGQQPAFWGQTEMCSSCPWGCPKDTDGGKVLWWGLWRQACDVAWEASPETTFGPCKITAVRAWDGIYKKGEKGITVFVMQGVLFVCFAFFL